MPLTKDSANSRNARIKALRKRHEDLKNTIKKEEQHPSVDYSSLKELKAQKLILKDLISNIEAEESFIEARRAG